MLIWVQRYNIFLYKGRKVIRYFLYRGKLFSKTFPPIKETFFKLLRKVRICRKLLRKMRIPRYWIFLSMLFVLGKELVTES